MHGPCGLEADLFSLGWVLHGIATGQRLARRGEGRPLRCVLRAAVLSDARNPCAESRCCCFAVCVQGAAGLPRAGCVPDPVLLARRPSCTAQRSASGAGAGAVPVPKRPTSGGGNLTRPAPPVMIVSYCGINSCQTLLVEPGEVHYSVRTRGILLARLIGAAVNVAPRFEGPVSVPAL